MVKGLSFTWWKAILFLHIDATILNRLMEMWLKDWDDYTYCYCHIICFWHPSQVGFYIRRGYSHWTYCPVSNIVKLHHDLTLVLNVRTPPRTNLIIHIVLKPSKETYLSCPCFGTDQYPSMWQHRITSPDVELGNDVKTNDVATAICVVISILQSHLHEPVWDSSINMKE